VTEGTAVKQDGGRKITCQVRCSYKGSEQYLTEPADRLKRILPANGGKKDMPEHACSGPTRTRFKGDESRKGQNRGGQAMIVCAGNGW